MVLRFSPVWLFLLILFSACEPSPHHKAVLAVVPAANPTVTSASSVAPVDLGEKNDAEEGMSTAEICAYRAHMDSVKVLNSLLQQSDLTLTTEAFTIGDLNGDGQRDFIILAHGKATCDSVTGLPNTYCRTVVLVLNHGWPTLTVAASNARMVDCSTCGGGGVGDPHQGFEIIDNAFTVNSLYGDCDKSEISYTFRYQPKKHNWFLQYADRSNYSCHEDSKKHHTRQTSRQFGAVPFSSFVADF